MRNVVNANGKTSEPGWWFRRLQPYFLEAIDDSGPQNVQAANCTRRHIQAALASLKGLLQLQKEGAIRERSGAHHQHIHTTVEQRQNVLPDRLRRCGFDHDIWLVLGQSQDIGGPGAPVM